MIDLKHSSIGQPIQNIRLFNLNGAILMEHIELGATIDVSHLPKGIYWVSAQLADRMLTQKLVVN